MVSTWKMMNVQLNVNPVLGLIEKRFFVKGVVQLIAFNVQMLMIVPNILVQILQQVNHKYGTVSQIDAITVQMENSGTLKPKTVIMDQIIYALVHFMVIEIQRCVLYVNLAARNVQLHQIVKHVRMTYSTQMLIITNVLLVKLNAKHVHQVQIAKYVQMHPQYGTLIKDLAKNVSMMNTGMLQQINALALALTITMEIEIKSFVKTVRETA